MRPRIVFRADGGPQLGVGHLSRCRSLAQALSAEGADCWFASLPKSRDMLPPEASSEFVWHDVESGSDADVVGRACDAHADVLIIDNYAISREFETSARRWARRIAVIDDRPVRPHDCDILLDQNCSDATRWRPFLPGSAVVLAGPSYALLNAAVREGAKRAKGVRGSRALLTMGGADPNGLSERLLPCVADSLPRGWELDVVAGPVYGRVEQLKTTCRQHGARFHHALSSMVPLFKACRLAVTAAGGTCWELAAFGVAMIVIVEEDNQHALAGTIGGSGAGMIKSSKDPALEQNVGQSIRELAGSLDLVDRMAAAGRLLVDGDGATRVAGILLGKLCAGARA